MNIIKKTWERFLELQMYIEEKKKNLYVWFWMSYIKKFVIIGVVIHEYSHLVALRILGFEGVIKSTHLDAVYPLEWVLMNDWQRVVFHLAGGLGQVAYGTYNILFTSQEDQQIMVDMMIIIQGLIYGYCEAFMATCYRIPGALIGFFSGWLFLVLYIWKENRRFFG